MQHQDDLNESFDTLKALSEQQRTVIKSRYRFLMNEYRFRARIYSLLFYTLKTTMTVGSLAVPALLSLQNTVDLYWFTWGLSLAVTTANGIMTLFKLETKFLTLHSTMEQIRTETWQYLQLAGRYSGHHGHETPTHLNQYVFYCSKIEKIRMKQVGEEYTKHGDIENHTQAIQRMNQTNISVPSPADQAIIRVRRESIRTVEDESELKTAQEKSALSMQNT